MPPPDRPRRSSSGCRNCPSARASTGSSGHSSTSATAARPGGPSSTSPPRAFLAQSCGVTLHDVLALPPLLRPAERPAVPIHPLLPPAPVEVHPIPERLGL